MPLKQAAALRHVIAAGEKMSWDCVREFAVSTVSTACLWNSYGASESSSTMWLAPRDPALMKDGPACPVGTPMLYCEVYLLEFDSLDRVKDGEAGEMAFSGALSHGYLNRVEATNMVYFPNPYGPGMLYRMGENAPALHAPENATWAALSLAC